MSIRIYPDKYMKGCFMHRFSVFSLLSCLVFLAVCLAERMENVNRLEAETAAWVENRNAKDAEVNWQFTTAEARIKLKKLYPSIEI
jgi:hypothetical protein